MSSGNFVVIGGSHGIGLGLVKRLQANGAQVTVVSRTEGDLAQLPGVSHIRADVTEDVALEGLPENISGLAYCPGSINLGPVRALKPDAMLQDYQLNVVGAVSCLQACLNGLKAAGPSSVVFFSTVAVGQGLPMHASVSAVKGALEGLTRSLAAELAPKIRVNCIAPSLTDTPLAEKFLSSDQKREAMDNRHPLKRVGTVDDVAAVAAFLLGDESTWITGQILGVDGGLSTLRP